MCFSGIKYFKRSEMACRCGCGFATFDFELAMVLDDLREHFGEPVIIYSGCRCKEYNEVVQKRDNPEYIPYSSKSKHMEAIAADVVVLNVAPSRVYAYLANKYPSKYGIGSYKTFTHIDVRPDKARW